MHTFKDTAGREWRVEVTVADVKRVRALVGVDVYALVTDRMRPLAELFNDPVKVVDVVFALVERQAREQGVTDEEFGRALAGDAIAGAADAFYGALIDFFPSPTVREALRKGLAVRDAVTRRADAQAMEGLATLDVEELAARILRDSLGTTSSGPSGGAPASAASTPTPSP